MPLRRTRFLQSIGMRKIPQTCRRQDTRWVSDIKKKGPGVQTLNKTHRACLGSTKVARPCAKRTLRVTPCTGSHFWREAVLPAGKALTAVRRHQPPTQEELLRRSSPRAALLWLRKATRGPCVFSLPCLNKATLLSDTRRPWAPPKCTAGVGTQVACDGVDR